MRKLLAGQTYKNIISGWSNYVFPSVRFEIMAHSRAAICAGCDHAKKGKFEALIKDNIKEIEGIKCTLCGCPLSPKLRSAEEKCPENKW